MTAWVASALFGSRRREAAGFVWIQSSVRETRVYHWKHRADVSAEKARLSEARGGAMLVSSRGALSGRAPRSLPSCFHNILFSFFIIRPHTVPHTHIQSEQASSRNNNPSTSPCTSLHVPPLFLSLSLPLTQLINHQSD